MAFLLSKNNTWTQNIYCTVNICILTFKTKNYAYIKVDCQNLYSDIYVAFTEILCITPVAIYWELSL